MFNKTWFIYFDFYNIFGDIGVFNGLDAAESRMEEILKNM